MLMTLLIEHSSVIRLQAVGGTYSVRATLVSKTPIKQNEHVKSEVARLAERIPLVASTKSRRHQLSQPLSPAPVVRATPSATSAESGEDFMPQVDADRRASTKVAPVSSGVDAEGVVAAGELRAYRLALGREARRLKLEFDQKYSRLDQGLQGRVEMNVRTGAGETAVLLTRSSGYPVLDDQALELIGRAVRQTALPDALLGRVFLLPVALEFEVGRQ